MAVAARDLRRDVGGCGGGSAGGVRGARGEEEGWTFASRETVPSIMVMMSVATTDIGMTMAGLSQNGYGR